jgi:hypothetical protein
MAGTVTTLTLHGPAGVTGSGYVAGDTGLIRQGANLTCSFHIATVDGSGTPIFAAIDSGGSNYAVQWPVTLVPGGAQPLHGTGWTPGIFTCTSATGPGPISDYNNVDQNGGSGYALGDTGTITGGNNDAAYIVLSIFSGVVRVLITSAGTGYSPGTYATAVGGAQPGAGSGLTLTINGVLNTLVPASGSGYINQLLS